MQIGLRRLLSQRRIRSVRLTISLLRDMLAGVLLQRLLNLTFLDLNPRGFLSLALLLLLPLLVVLGLALLSLTFLDIPFLTLLQLALLADLRLVLLHLPLF